MDELNSALSQRGTPIWLSDRSYAFMHKYLFMFYVSAHKQSERMVVKELLREKACNEIKSPMRPMFYKKHIYFYLNLKNKNKIFGNMIDAYGVLDEYKFKWHICEYILSLLFFDFKIFCDVLLDGCNIHRFFTSAVHKIIFFEKMLIHFHCFFYKDDPFLPSFQMSQR